MLGLRGLTLLGEAAPIDFDAARGKDAPTLMLIPACLASQVLARKAALPLAKAKIETHILAVASNEMPLESDCLIDLHGDFVRLYGMRGQFLCLVRPDDHIGLFQRPVNHKAFRSICLLSPNDFRYQFVVSTPIECVLRVDLARRGGVPPSHPEVALMGNNGHCVTQDSLYGL